MASSVGVGGTYGGAVQGAAGFDVERILFDLDGTLVDSTASVRRAWERVSGQLARPMSAFEPYLHGIPAPQVFAVVTPELTPEQVADLTEQMLVQQVGDTAGVVAQPGARAAVDDLPDGRWAVVTSGDRRLAPARLRAAGLPIPPVLITTDDVEVGKPDPACYLLAARRLRTVPRRCLVVEDAPAGIAAGRAAGMPVLGVRTTYPELDGADATVADLRDVQFAVGRDGVRVILRQSWGASP